MLAGLRMWAAYMPAAYYVLGRLCLEPPSSVVRP